MLTIIDRNAFNTLIWQSLSDIKVHSAHVLPLLLVLVAYSKILRWRRWKGTLKSSKRACWLANHNSCVKFTWFRCVKVLVVCHWCVENPIDYSSWILIHECTLKACSSECALSKSATGNTVSLSHTHTHTPHCSPWTD